MYNEVKMEVWFCIYIGGADSVEHPSYGTEEVFVRTCCDLQA